MSKPNAEQVEIAEELQTMLLKEFRTKLREGTATSTDLATLARLLQNNGWTINPADLPQDLQSYITSEVDPEADLEQDADIQVMG